MPRKFRVTSNDATSLRLLYVDQLEGHPVTHTYEVEAENVGDEYHTLHELYQHRMALTIAFTKLIETLSDTGYGGQLYAFRSKKHHPDSNQMFEGYFIVWVEKNHKTVMSYHYDLKHWDKFDHLVTMNHAPEYDGHTPKDVVERLMDI